MRIGIDAMGGDRSPGEEVKGALAARQFLRAGDRIVLIGQETIIREHLDGQPDWAEFILSPGSIVKVRPSSEMELHIPP